MKRSLLCGSVLVSALALGQARPESPEDCNDAFADCKEDCTISYGATFNEKARSKLNGCLNKCGSVELDCRERFFDTRRNGLDEGSLDKKGSKKSGERTKVSEAPAEPPPRDHDNDLRDDRPRARRRRRRRRRAPHGKKSRRR